MTGPKRIPILICKGYCFPHHYFGLYIEEIERSRIPEVLYSNQVNTILFIGEQNLFMLMVIFKIYKLSRTLWVV